MSIAHIINPFSKPTTEAEARMKARASAIALFLSAALGAVGVILLQQNPELLQSQIEAQVAAQGAGAPEGMGDLVTSMAIGGGWFMVIVQVLLGLIQWWKPNIVIPIIMLILTAFGLLSALGQWAMNPEQARLAMELQPLWLMVANWIVMVLGVLLHLSSILGVNQLNSLRRQGKAD